jgi:hypothetical protein
VVIEFQSKSLQQAAKYFLSSKAMADNSGKPLHISIVMLVELMLTMLNLAEAAEQINNLHIGTTGSAPVVDQPQGSTVERTTYVAATDDCQEDASDDEFYDSHEYSPEELEVLKIIPSGRAN